MENAMSRRKRILLTGSCEYELQGLSLLLAGMGYEAVREEASPPGSCDFTLVALSAEPLTGWGRHLQGIRMRYAAMPLPMVVLVPDKLKGMRLLRGAAHVVSGRDCLSRLRTMLWLAFETFSKAELSGGLTRLQLQSLVSMQRAINRKESLKVTSHKDYYPRAKLVEYAGVENLHVLCVSGLLSEMITDGPGNCFDM
ncbi:hypothetical protein H5Y57_004609 [Salmonella enterica]|nr:hypothetical protein [Salmonella enterica]EBZ4432466.1 hypothetical protein [Salmonella enterica subsp. enterica serovar Derby]EDQ5792016.1 hypothetical protein [Salmonella enterica subsp. enterica serovar Poona]ECG2984942.1 hypothetical protein [Salmonella enterica subsp. enterica serovar Derby]ECL4188470.1 hypothetical protein [Salmonella enterica]